MLLGEFFLADLLRFGKSQPEHVYRISRVPDHLRVSRGALLVIDCCHVAAAAFLEIISHGASLTLDPSWHQGLTSISTVLACRAHVWCRSISWNTRPSSLHLQARLITAWLVRIVFGDHSTDLFLRAATRLRVFTSQFAVTQACRIANDEMARIVARFPRRLIGVALIPTTTEEASRRSPQRSRRSTDRTP